jgi:hypothetical protein
LELEAAEPDGYRGLTSSEPSPDAYLKPGVRGGRRLPGQQKQRVSSFAKGGPLRTGPLLAYEPLRLMPRDLCSAVYPTNFTAFPQQLLASDRRRDHLQAVAGKETMAFSLMGSPPCFL